MWFQIILVALAASYFYLKYIYSYWDRAGVPNFKPVIPFGNLKPVVKQELSFGMVISEMYNKTKEPFMGIYLFFRPAVLVRDPELVHKILASDFSSFHDRGTYTDEKRDPFTGDLFSLPGEKWRLLRNQITPTMTSGKLKSMFETVMKVANTLSNQLNAHTDKSNVINMKEYATRYSLDIVGNVIFGLDINTLEDPEHEFWKVHQKILNPTFIEGLRGAASFLCPGILKFLRIPAVPNSIRSWMIGLITSTIDAREKQNYTRKDFMQLLIQLRNTGKVEDDDDNWEIKSNNKAQQLKFTIEQCAGQTFIFYIAGSETSSSAISFCLHELCQNPQYLTKLQQEIDEGVKKYNGEITYELLSELPFLEMCLQETLRKYPGLPILNRVCTKDYEDPATNFKIKEGMQVIIPLYGIQRDPLHFNDPDQFDPYRFEVGKHNFDEKCYMPFGDGPHICIGMRMAKVVTKVAITKILMNFNFEMIKKGELEFAPGSIAIVAKDGVNLKITKRVK